MLLKSKNIAVVILLCISCNTKQRKISIVTSHVTVIHDTIILNRTARNIDQIDSMVPVLLIQYYKAGWMDASNNLIDLYNMDNLNKSQIEKVKSKDWRKMEALISLKSKRLIHATKE